MRRCSIGICLGLAVLALLGGCSSGPQLSEAAQRGRSTYLSVCIACHNQDPAKEGAVGPAIADSSRELLEARVVYAGYPPGYAPKRDSKAMPPFPQLADQIDDLHAFLSECCKTSSAAAHELTTAPTR